MVIVTGLQVTPAGYESLEKSLLDGPFLLKRFSGDFLSWMQRAVLSISQGGYNTTMNVLQTRTRAIFAPNCRMSDQIYRSQLLAEKGLVEIIDPQSISADELADLICSVLSRPVLDHNFDLDGAQRTCDIITALL
jgi:predicted glycosyltransferase